ncbi:MAG TPA: TolC family protein [Verrucomicrobiae bacterium]|jgi:outer membrane protein|nr:TolC family protein [Verrucomicrobiae bacterium]
MKRIFVILSAGALVFGATAFAATDDLPTLKLSEAHDLALKNHPQIAAANYRALAAEEATKESRAGFFPQVNLYGSAVGADSVDTRIEAGGLNNPSVFDRAAGGLSASQLITDFGRTANLTASSEYQAQAEGQNANATREQVLLSVDVNYFAALQAQAVMNVAQQTLDTRRLLLDRVTVLASNKLKSDLDVSFARVAFEEGQLLLQRAQNDFEASLASLSAGLGFRDFRRFKLVEQPLPPSGDTNNVSALIDTALRDRPEIMALTNQREAASRFARAQRDSRLPTISAVGAAGASPVHDNRLPDNYAAGGLQLSLPVFAGGLYAARQHEAELRARADAELLRSLEDNVIRDVRIAWLHLNNARERLRTTEQLVNHAQEAFDLEQARYQAGSSSIVELSQAQLELTSAQIAATSARYDVLIQEANVNYQIGGLSATDQPPGSFQKQIKHS